MNNDRAAGAMMAMDLMSDLAPEQVVTSEEGLAECRSVLAMHGYRLQTSPTLRAVRGRDESGNKSETR
jgi:hypothetical protein